MRCSVYLCYFINNNSPEVGLVFLQLLVTDFTQKLLDGFFFDFRNPSSQRLRQIRTNLDRFGSGFFCWGISRNTTFKLGQIFGVTTSEIFAIWGFTF